MKFTKMQGIGNDYVYINCFEEKVENPTELAKKISDRHFGVGSDGLILILPSEMADCKMRMFNWDGSESEMCGNGIRCVAKYVYTKNIAKKDIITVETLAGIKTISVEKDIFNNAKNLKVNMGNPVFTPKEVPVLSDEKIVKNLKIKALDKEFTFTCLSMGNPHAITFIENLEEFEVEKYGKILELDKHFPQRANIEFIEVIDKNNIKMRVWERGSGETLACGTGACASVVAGFLTLKCERENVKVNLLGGSLIIDWCEKDNNVYMTGAAEFVFEGEWNN